MQFGLVLGHYLVNNVKAQTGSFPSLLGSKEGIEYLLLGFFIHPGSRVSNRDVTCPVIHTCCQSDGPDRLHCVHAIIDEVRDYLRYL